MTMNDNAKACLREIRNQIDAIDNEMIVLGEKLDAGLILPTLVMVREITLRSRRETLQNQFNAVNASIRHF